MYMSVLSETRRRRLLLTLRLVMIYYEEAPKWRGGTKHGASVPRKQHVSISPGSLYCLHPPCQQQRKRGGNTLELES